MKESKNKKIEAKCTKTEHEKVLKMASENNMTVAEFVRARVLSEYTTKYNLFETRAMRILSSCAAWLQLKANDLTDEEFAEFEAILKEIKGKNEVDEVLSQNNNDHQ